MAAHERPDVGAVAGGHHVTDRGARDEAVVDEEEEAAGAEEDAGGEAAEGDADVVVDVEARHAAVRAGVAPRVEALGVQSAIPWSEDAGRTFGANSSEAIVPRRPMTNGKAKSAQETAKRRRLSRSARGKSRAKKA